MSSSENGIRSSNINIYTYAYKYVYEHVYKHVYKHVCKHVHINMYICTCLRRSTAYAPPPRPQRTGSRWGRWRRGTWKAGGRGRGPREQGTDGADGHGAARPWAYAGPRRGRRGRRGAVPCVHLAGVGGRRPTWPTGGVACVRSA